MDEIDDTPTNPVFTSVAGRIGALESPLGDWDTHLCRVPRSFAPALSLVRLRDRTSMRAKVDRAESKRKRKVFPRGAKKEARDKPARPRTFPEARRGLGKEGQIEAGPRREGGRSVRIMEREKFESIPSHAALTTAFRSVEYSRVLDASWRIRFGGPRSTHALDQRREHAVLVFAAANKERKEDRPRDAPRKKFGQRSGRDVLKATSVPLSRERAAVRARFAARRGESPPRERIFAIHIGTRAKKQSPGRWVVVGDPERKGRKWCGTNDECAKGARGCWGNASVPRASLDEAPDGWVYRLPRGARRLWELSTYADRPIPEEASGKTERLPSFPRRNGRLGSNSNRRLASAYADKHSRNVAGFLPDAKESRLKGDGAPNRRSPDVVGTVDRVRRVYRGASVLARETRKKGERETEGDREARRAYFQETSTGLAAILSENRS
ncbi:hypothetical protein KM043_004816 [Ampulex compressa]|nr:hypothetical protein KM043_004816 [Ampulex compressa]